MEENQSHAREGEIMLNNGGLRHGRDESEFRRYFQGRGLSASKKDRYLRNVTTGGLTASRVWSTTQNERHCACESWNNAWVFRENVHNLTFPLKHILDHCLAQGKFPACLKKSKVISLPKVATPVV